jgi:hypothetical protein
VHANVENNERIRHLIAAIQIEADPNRLTALVTELNRALDGDSVDTRPSPPDEREINSRVSEAAQPPNSFNGMGERRK